MNQKESPIIYIYDTGFTNFHYYLSVSIIRNPILLFGNCKACLYKAQ